MINIVSLVNFSHLHSSNITHPAGVKNYLQYFNELNIQGFNFTNDFICSDVHKFNEINNLSVSIYESNFYQDETNWKHKLIPIENSKNESDNVIDLLICKNHYALIKKIHVLLGKPQQIFCM